VRSTNVRRVVVARMANRPLAPVARSIRILRPVGTEGSVSVTRPRDTRARVARGVAGRAARLVLVLVRPAVAERADRAAVAEAAEPAPAPAPAPGAAPGGGKSVAAAVTEAVEPGLNHWPPQNRNARRRKLCGTPGLRSWIVTAEPRPA
jgi:hypothetical protein